MPDFTLTAVATVVVVVAGAEVTRLVHAQHNAVNPKAPPLPVSTVMGPVMGGFVLGLFLFAVGIASEHLASLLCLLLIVGSLLMNGQNLFSALNHSTT